MGTARKDKITFTGDHDHMANLLLTLLGAVAQFERSLILERQREGIAKAKRNGVYRGRKPNLTPECEGAGLKSGTPLRCCSYVSLCLLETGPITAF